MGDFDLPTSERKEIHTIEEHFHPPEGEKWVPTAADDQPLPAGTTLTSDGAPNDGSFGAWVQILAATSGTRWTDFDEILVLAASADEEYEVEIGIGAGGSEVGNTRMHFIFDSVGGLALRVPARGPNPRIAPGTRVAARVRNRTANQRTCEVRFGYHEYTPGL